MRSLLCLALLAAAPMAMADVPARTFPSAAETGHSREQPQAMSHWQKIAVDMAREAAPVLKEKGLSVSSNVYGESSTFDALFHDFFVTALHREGVSVTKNSYGARVELDTRELEFHSRPKTHAAADTTCSEVRGRERCRDDRSRYHKALSRELALSVRIFDGGDLAFSGSTTYYVPEADKGKYRAKPRAEHTRSNEVLTTRDGDNYRSLEGEYGTKSWGGK